MVLNPKKEEIRQKIDFLLSFPTGQSYESISTMVGVSARNLMNYHNGIYLPNDEKAKLIDSACVKLLMILRVIKKDLYANTSPEELAKKFSIAIDTYALEHNLLDEIRKLKK